MFALSTSLQKESVTAFALVSWEHGRMMSSFGADSPPSMACTVPSNGGVKEDPLQCFYGTRGAVLFSCTGDPGVNHGSLSDKATVYESQQKHASP